jgi:hypothetical protein
MEEPLAAGANSHSPVSIGSTEIALFSFRDHLPAYWSKSLWFGTTPESFKADENRRYTKRVLSS